MLKYVVTFCSYYKRRRSSTLSYKLEDAGKQMGLQLSESLVPPPRRLTSVQIITAMTDHATPRHHPPRQAVMSASCLPASQPASPTDNKLPHPRFHPCACTDRLGQIGTIPPSPPLPPTLPLHCAPQQPLLRGLIPRSDHHLYLLC